MTIVPSRPPLRGATSDSWRSLRTAQELHRARTRRKKLSPLLDATREH
jgi:hypothetical protein